MLNFAKQMMSFTLGPLNPSVNVFHWLEWILQKHLPSNAHQLANRRLAVSMTRLTDGKHIVISEYKSKEDVLQVSKDLRIKLKVTLQPSLEPIIFLLHMLPSGSAV